MDKEKRKHFTDHYFNLWLTLFLAGCGIILFYYCVYNTKNISQGFGVISSILSPFIWGAIMAYLLCPVYNVVTKLIYKGINGKFKTKRKALSFSKIMSTIVAMIVLLGVIAGFFALVIPSLIETVSVMVNSLPGEFSAAVDWIEKNIAANPDLVNSFTGTLGDIQNSLTTWAKEVFLPNAGNLVSGVSQGIFGTLKFLLNFIVGLILCVYFLNSKEKFLAQTKEIVLATFKKDRANGIFELGSTAHRNFGGFINGKIIDSFIIGLICFVLMMIFEFPYPTLISVIVGLTNIIPFFGPFIGAIPSALIILLVNPIQAVYFCIMILGLQQVDGNIIGPKILGETTGLASFWVMFAILVFGGLFGFMGMIIGVPLFAIIYTYFGRFIKKKLRAKDLPVNTWDYEKFEKYGIDNKEDVL